MQTIKTIFSITILFIVATLHSAAQNETEAIQTTIRKFFTGMRMADTVLLKSTLSPTAVLHTIGRNKEMKPIVKVEELNGFISFVGAQTPGRIDERIDTITTLQDGPLASAWMAYSFYYEGKLLHCGIDSFQLVKLDGVWKIQYIIDTRRKENCKEIK